MLRTPHRPADATRSTRRSTKGWWRHLIVTLKRPRPHWLQAAPSVGGRLEAQRRDAADFALRTASVAVAAATLRALVRGRTLRVPRLSPLLMRVMYSA